MMLQFREHESFAKLSFSISLSVVLFAGLYVTYAHANDGNLVDFSVCRIAIEHLGMEEFPILDKDVCSKNISGQTVNFSVTITGARRGPLLSSGLQDYFEIYGKNNYVLSQTDNENVYKIGHDNLENGEYLSDRFDSYIVAGPLTNTTWVRCSKQLQDGCVLYEDILPRNAINYNDGNVCSTFIRASFPRNTDASDILSIVQNTITLANLTNSSSSKKIKSLCEKRK